MNDSTENAGSETNGMGEQVTRKAWCEESGSWIEQVWIWNGKTYEWADK